jgi:elongation factor P hydroxylase
MQALKVSFYVYADTQQQAQELERALHEFVQSKREQGIAVKAQHLIQAINNFKDNFFVTQFLRQ